MYTIYYWLYFYTKMNTIYREKATETVLDVVRVLM